MVLGLGYINNPAQWLIWKFQDFLVIFIAVLKFTGAVTFLLQQKNKQETKSLSELQNIQSELDELTN